MDECKDTIFDNGADVILERLTKAADAIGETLDDAMGKLAEKVGPIHSSSHSVGTRFFFRWK